MRQKHSLLVFILLSLFVGSCSSFNKYYKEKPVVLNIKPPQGSPWSVKQVIRSTEKPDPVTHNVIKDTLIFANGTQVENIAFDLKYRDAFTNPRRPEEITYFYEGSPCQNCDGITSLYLINPVLGKPKLVFLPGNYFATDPDSNQSHLEFKGELYFGKCLESYPSGVFLYKETFHPNAASEQKLVYVGSFQENYMTKVLEIILKDEILQEFGKRTSACYQLESKKSIQIPM